MNRDVVRHMLSLPFMPVLDVLGQWVCCPNPKTATGSMVGIALSDRQILHREGPRSWDRVWLQIIGPRLDELFLFTFVRNPWDKVVSAFFWLQQKKRNEIASDMSFREFVTEDLASVGTSVNRHFAEQWPTFMFCGQPIPGMFVGRFERLHEDWAYVAGRLRLPKDLPHKNVSQHRHYTEYYDDECVEIVRALYHEEIAELGYEFGQ